MSKSERLINELNQTIEYLRFQLNDALLEIKELNEYIKRIEVKEEEEEKAEEEEINDVSPLASCEEEAKFIPLKDYELDYEIKNYFPFEIRRKSNKRIAKEAIHKSDGYIRVNLNQVCKFKHILVAKQFIFNDDPKNKNIVDHIDRNRTNFHVSNLRWCTQKTNMKNISAHARYKYEFISSIPDDSINVESYGKHSLTNYYYYDNKFYFYSGVDYRILIINEDKLGKKYVNMTTNEGKYIKVYYAVFKQQRGLID